MLPNFLIIGAPKAATTWIADGLREHPEVFVPPLKELRYFCGQNYDKGQDWYEEYFNGVNGEIAIGEASPSYLGSDAAPHRIRQVIPGARLIVTLRHPVEQAFSFYWHQLSRGVIPLNTDFGDFFRTDRPRASYYGAHLSRYLKLFDRERILILLYEEDVEKNPVMGMRKCYDYLGVDADFSPAVIANKSNARNDVTAIHGVARIARACVKALPREIAHPLKKAGKSIVRRLPKKRMQRKLDPELKHQLFEQYYSEDTKRLERVSGKDFCVWYAA